MKIIKKDGRIEEFNIKKIKTSIENAARDSESMLNESDLKIITSDIENTLLKIRKDTLITSSYEVIGVIFEILKRNGFNSVLKSYVEFGK
ncbi:hypothetical protein E5347_08455 [Clostridium sartagoforme]|uniref:ATP-cone domain-containing protein n=1 Tax=Clostridium sartagoforme TaxID=84031 RepID=A0A4S2DKN7_9CLOT|nr:ATP cone domain-containing protein [Clostridium sartagoforme]TGY42826.1 hypothetical protein E5347_08455 [Clostridium sartagoforme]